MNFFKYIKINFVKYIIQVCFAFILNLLVFGLLIPFLKLENINSHSQAELTQMILERFSNQDFSLVYAFVFILLVLFLLELLMDYLAWHWSVRFFGFYPDVIREGEIAGKNSRNESRFRSRL